MYFNHKWPKEYLKEIQISKKKNSREKLHFRRESLIFTSKILWFAIEELTVEPDDLRLIPGTHMVGES